MCVEIVQNLFALLITKIEQFVQQCLASDFPLFHHIN